MAEPGDGRGIAARDRTFKQVAPLRQCLDQALPMIADRLTDIADTTGEGFVGHRHIRPDCRHQFILGDGLIGVFGEVAQDLKALRAQLDFAAGAEQAKTVQIKCHGIEI